MNRTISSVAAMTIIAVLGLGASAMLILVANSFTPTTAADFLQREQRDIE